MESPQWVDGALKVWNTVGPSLWKVWGAVGPLAGVFVGAVLSRRWQRAQWIADNKRSEYRKLLTTLTKTYTDMLELRTRLTTPLIGLGPAEQKRLASLEPTSVMVIRDRLFIKEEMEEIDLLKRWLQAIRGYEKTRDGNAFIEEINGIMGDIRGKASELFRE